MIPCPIQVTIHRFDLPAASAEWAALHANLSGWGYSQYLMPQAERYAALPHAGKVQVTPHTTGYTDAAGTVLHDWTLYPISPRRRVGYWIELPDGQTPAAPDMTPDPSASNMQQAIAWLQAGGTRTQLAVASMFNVKQGNLSVALQRARRI